MLTKITGNLAHPHGETIPVPVLEGYAQFERSKFGITSDGYVTGPDKIRTSIKDGILAPVHVTQGKWRARIFPSDGLGEWSFTFIIPPNAESFDLQDAPFTLDVDGKEYVRGEDGKDGYTAYELAVNNGYAGTVQEWITSLRMTDNGFTVTPSGPGMVTLEGPALYSTNPGTVSILSGIKSPDAWSVSSLAAGQGRPITYLSYDAETNAIYSSFGDWTANNDYVGITRHDIDTGKATVIYAPIPAEAVGCVTRMQGHLYAPFIDAHGYWEPSGGYCSDEDGTWKPYPLPKQPIHVFEMLETPEGLWACGSRITDDQTTGVATLWHRPVGGEWRIEKEGVRGDYSRYYTMDVVGGVVVPSTLPKYRGSSVTVGPYTYTGADKGQIIRK